MNLTWVAVATLIRDGRAAWREHAVPGLRALGSGYLNLISWLLTFLGVAVVLGETAVWMRIWGAGEQLPPGRWATWTVMGAGLHFGLFLAGAVQVLAVLTHLVLIRQTSPGRHAAGQARPYPDVTQGVRGPVERTIRGDDPLDWAPDAATRARMAEVLAAVDTPPAPAPNGLWS